MTNRSILRQSAETLPPPPPRGKSGRGTHALSSPSMGLETQSYCAMHLKCGNLVQYFVNTQISQADLTDNEYFSRRLREERVRLCPKQLKFAEISGIKNTLLSVLENGKQKIMAEHLAVLSKAGIDIGYVITGARSSALLSLPESAVLDSFRALDESGREAVLLVVQRMTANTHAPAPSVAEPQPDDPNGPIPPPSD